MIVALATMLLASCSFLDIDTENKIASEAVDYSNTSEMYKPVIGAYSQLRTSGMHWANNMLWIGRDDDMTSGRDDDQGDALLFGYRGGYQQPNSFWAVNNAWVTPYEIIRTCNSALEALDQYAGYLAEGSADYKTYLSYQGEVLFTSVAAPSFNTGNQSHVGFYTGNPSAPFLSHFANGGPYVTAINGVYGGRESYYGVRRYTPGSEDDMSASEVWGYDYEGTAPLGNMYNCVVGMYKNAQASKFWEYDYNGTAPGGNMYNCVAGISNKVDELAEKVENLQINGASVDYDKLADAVADKIAKRMMD